MPFNQTPGLTFEGELAMARRLSQVKSCGVARRRRRTFRAVTRMVSRVPAAVVVAAVLLLRATFHPTRGYSRHRLCVVM